MVELMDGTITVESEYGKGSTFTVKINQGFVTDEPIGKAVAESLRSFRHFDQKKARNTKLTRISLPYARVLLVDDVPANLDVARGMMKPYGMKVDCVTDGPDAIERIRSGEVKYNAIFMDHMMPGMDGIEAANIIREEIDTDYAKNIPIIALTANAIRGNAEMFLQHGFQDFLSKPIDIMRLDAIIRQWVRDKELEKEFLVAGTEDVINTRSNAPRRSGEDRRSGMDRRLEALKAKADNTPPSPHIQIFGGKIIDGLDLEAALKRFGMDESSLLTVLSSYARGTPLLFDQIRTVSRETLSDYAIAVHGIKGSSRGICAEPVATQAEALEHAAKDGNFAFVTEHNGPFLEAAVKLVTDIETLLREIDAENPKPIKSAPDPALLAKLRDACASYDMDEVEKAMSELKSYNYESEQDLVLWLYDQAALFQFDEIVKKLA
jgi:CheY-like chemotaxis protein